MGLVDIVLFSFYCLYIFVYLFMYGLGPGSVVPREKTCVCLYREESLKHSTCRSPEPEKITHSAEDRALCFRLSAHFSFILCFFWSGSCLLRTGFQRLYLALLAAPSWLPLQLFKIMFLQLIFMPTEDWISCFISRFGLDSETVYGFENKIRLHLHWNGHFKVEGCQFKCDWTYIQGEVTSRFTVNSFKLAAKCNIVD